MPLRGLVTRLAAILYADAVAYTRLTSRDQEGVHRALLAAFGTFEAFITRSQGRVIMKAGDSVLAEFSSIAAAVFAAVEIQRAFGARPLLTTTGEALRFRIGINLGDVIIDNDNIYGDGVNLAERAQGLSRPGGICITETVYASIANTTPYAFEFGGENAVKNVDKLLRVYHFRETAGGAAHGAIRNPYAHTRKYAVVLAARMLKRAAFLNRHEPDEISAVETEIAVLFQEVMRRHDGVVLVSSGGLNCAAFGIPVAHDDDPERAVTAAQALCTALKTVADGRVAETRWAIGIDIGFTTIEQPADLGVCKLVGKPVMTASVLAEEARHEGVLVTRGLLPAVARSFRCIAVPDDEISDIPAWRIAGPLEAGAARQGPLVGRAAEVAQLTAVLLATKTHGNGCVVEIRGEAGIGKTRLAEQALSIARNHGFFCCRLAARSFVGAPSLGMLASLIRGLCEVDAGASEAVCRSTIESSPLVASLEPNHRILLYDLLDLPLPPGPDSSFVSALDGTARRQARRSAFLALLNNLAATAPLLIVVEDIHRANEMFLSILRDIAGITPGIPAVLIATQRSEGSARGGLWDVTTAKPSTVTLDLRPLCQAEARSLAVALATAEGIAFDPAFVDRCIQQAAGNPFFLEQLLHHTCSDAIETPASILSVIAWRIGQLPQADQRALQAAAILGERFSEAALRLLLEDPKYELVGLIGRRFVVPDDDGLRFEHALLQEAAHASIGPERRLDLHRRAAEWFRTCDPVRHAEHLEQAKAPGAAAAFLAAGRAQMERFRFAIALGLIERGLLICREQGVRFDLLQTKGELLLGMGLAASSTGILKEAADLAETDWQRCVAAVTLAQNLILLDHYFEAARYLNAAEPLARSDVCRARIHRLRGSLYFPLGNTARCYAENEKAFKLARRSGSVEEEARALSGLGDAEYARGRMRSAYQAFRECVRLALESDLGRIEAENRHMVASSLHYVGRLGAALAEAEQALEVARRVSHPRAELCCHSCLSVIRFDLGDFEAVERHVAEAQDLAIRIGARRFLPLNLTYRAKIARLAGRAAEAEALIAEALEEARGVGMSYNGARVLSELALISRDPRTRSDALAEGRRILEGGCIGSNHLWFHRDTIDVGLATGDEEILASGVDRLLAYAEDQRLPWTQLYAVRGRLLGVARNGAAREASFQRRLQSLRSRAAAFDYHRVAAEVEALDRFPA